MELNEYFKRQTGEISYEKSWTWLLLGNLERETESLLIAVHNNARKYRLFGDRDEIINDIISECSKLL